MKRRNGLFVLAIAVLSIVATSCSKHGARCPAYGERYDIRQDQTETLVQLDEQRTEEDM